MPGGLTRSVCRRLHWFRPELPHPTMTAAFAFTRRRFLALVGGASALFLTRCAPTKTRPDGYGEAMIDTYTGPFFSDGSDFTE